MENKNVTPINSFETMSFWFDKSDDDYIKMATNEYGLDAEEALSNLLERDFWKDVSKNVLNELKK